MYITIGTLIFLNLLINLIASYSFSARIAGVRTQKIAVSFSVFNVLVLVSRTANGFQAPLLANYIEKTISGQYGLDPEFIFRLILFTYSIATIIGILTTPMMQRVFTKIIHRVEPNSTILNSFLLTFKNLYHKPPHRLILPKSTNLKALKGTKNVNPKIFILNVIGTSFLSVGVLSSIYAGYINPEFRATSSNLSALINGIATLIMFLAVDPYLSVLVDNVKDNIQKEIKFRQQIVQLMVARLLGTLIAQILFIPCARLLADISGWL